MKWPAELTTRIALRIFKVVQEGNVGLAASIAAQTAADFYDDPDCAVEPIP